VAGDGDPGAAGHCASVAPRGFHFCGDGGHELAAEAHKLCDADSRDGGTKPKGGAERLRGELLKLGIRVSKRTLQRT